MRERVVKRLLARLDAEDADGNDYELLIYQEFTEAEHQLGKITIPGNQFVVTSTGKHVDVIDNDTFVIVDKNIRLRRVKS